MRYVGTVQCSRGEMFGGYEIEAQTLEAAWAELARIARETYVNCRPFLLEDADGREYLRPVGGGTLPR